MERQSGLKGRIALYLIFGFGVLWHSLPFTFPYVLYLTPFALLTAYAVIIYPEIQSGNFRSIIWILIICMITFVIEVYGVKTGMIFGSYIYLNSLGIEIFDVPLLIGLNWGMIIWGSSEIANELKAPAYVKVLSASVLAVVLDLLIEPLSADLGYWRWRNDIIPLQNYIAWFTISLFVSGSYIIFKIRSVNRLPVHFYFSQVFFFGVLNILKVFIWEY